jgi:transcriptional regulator with XRE-family HTH domain
VNRELLRLFGKRLGEEMQARSISQNRMREMARTMGFKLGQSTVSRILAGKQDLTLGRLSILADCLGVPPWFLLMERDQTEQRVIRPAAIPKNVVQLGSPYPPMLRRSDDAQVKKTMKKKR